MLYSVEMYVVQFRCMVYSVAMYVVQFVDYVVQFYMYGVQIYRCMLHNMYDVQCLSYSLLMYNARNMLYR